MDRPAGMRRPTLRRAGVGLAPSNATYIVQTPSAFLPSAQALSSLATGLLKNTTGTGVLSIAVGGTDYVVPGGVAGGQTVKGGTAASETLTLSSTNHATKGTITIGGSSDLVVDEANHVVKIGPSEAPAVPSAKLQVYGTSNTFMVVRDTTSDVEVCLGNASTTGIVGTQTNHSMAISVNNTTKATFASGAVTLAEAYNLIVGTTTGTKIGTATNQKLGIWNATPVVQPSSTGETVGFTAGAGTNVTDASTFTGNTGATAYRISDVVKHLKTIGLIAS